MEHMSDEKRKLIENVKKMMGQDIRFVKDIMDAAMEKAGEK